MTQQAGPDVQAAPGVRGAHLVGSINYDDAETTMRRASSLIGPLLTRLPDGEPGKRFHWIMFQPDVLARTAGLERIGDEPVWLRDLDTRPLRLADGVNAADLVLPDLGYAAAARESYATFARLRDSGVIAPGTRFQVCLPTPTAVVGVCFAPGDRAVLEPIYRNALYGELRNILATIPHEDLAIQFDCAVEFLILETHDIDGGTAPWWDGDLWRGLVDRVAGAISEVPDDVETGIHLCYGDVAEKHFVEPRDTTNLVRFASGVLQAVERPLAWLHLPVPIERDDDAYFVGLEKLELPAATELYLGLVHREDGADGAARRIATAKRHVSDFGVSTECGIGRAPEGVTDGVLKTHAAVAAHC